MPQSGNTLGPRSYYRYTADTGDVYKYLTDDTIALAVGAVLDDQAPDLPKRFRPRYVLAQALDSGTLYRKKIVCPTIGTPAYDTDQSTDITIDGLVFSTTGRVGEKQSFGNNPGPQVVPG